MELGDTQLDHVAHPKFHDVSDQPIHKTIIAGSAQSRELQITDSNTTLNQVTPGTNSFSHVFSDTVVLDRVVYLRCRVQATLTGDADAVAANGHIASLRGFALSQYPLHRAMQSLSVELNNNALSVSPWEYACALLKTHSDADLMRYASTSGAKPDDYNTMAAMAISAGANVVAGTDLPENTVPLFPAASSSPFGDLNSSSYVPPRTQIIPVSHQFQAATNNGSAVHVLQYDLVEPLLHPFFNPSMDMEGTLGRITNMKVDITWGNLSACFQTINSILRTVSDGAVNLTVQGFAANSVLDMRSYVPNTPIPPSLSIPFTDIVMRRFAITEAALGTIGGTGSLSTGNIRLSQVPHKILLYANPTNQRTTSTQADAFLSMTSLTFRTDHDAGGLTNAQQHQLYQTSVRNGLNQTYAEFSSNQGSVVVLDLAAGDIAGFCPGARVPFTFDLTANFRNTLYTRFHGRTIPNLGNGTVASETTDWTFRIVCLMDSKMVLDGSTTTLVRGEDAGTIERLMLSQPVHVGSDYNTVRGGGFWGKVFKKIVKPLIKDARYVMRESAIKRLGGSVQAGGGMQAGGGLRAMA